MSLPSDPHLMLSVINMRLRDGGLSLDELCAEEDVSRPEIEQKLAEIGYKYSEERNAFIAV